MPGYPCPPCCGGDALTCGCGCHDWYLFSLDGSPEFLLPSGWEWIDGDFPTWNSTWREVKQWGSEDIVDTPAYECWTLAETQTFFWDWGHWAKNTIDANNWAEFFFFMRVTCQPITVPPEDPGVEWTPTIYDAGERVNHDDAVWESLEDDNDGEPGIDERWEEDTGTSEIRQTIEYELRGWTLKWHGYLTAQDDCCHKFATHIGPAPDCSVRGAVPPCLCGFQQGAICDWEDDKCARWTLLDCPPPDGRGTMGEIVYYPTSCKGANGVAALEPHVFDALADDVLWHECLVDGQFNVCMLPSSGYQCPYGYFNCLGDVHPVTAEPCECPGAVCWECYYVPSPHFPIEIQHRPSRANGFLTCDDICQSGIYDPPTHLSLHSGYPGDDGENNVLVSAKAASFAGAPDTCRKFVLETSVEFEGDPLTPAKWLGFWAKPGGDLLYIGAVEITAECFFNIDGRLEAYSPPNHPENAWVGYYGCPDTITGKLMPPSSGDGTLSNPPTMFGDASGYSIGYGFFDHPECP